MLICMHAVNFYNNHVYHVLMYVAKLNISFIHSSLCTYMQFMTYVVGCYIHSYVLTQLHTSCLAKNLCMCI